MSNNNLIPIDVIENKDGIPMTSSRFVSEVFNKQHKNILRSIRNIIEKDPKTLNKMFVESSYINTKGKTCKEYLLTKDGFTFIAMGFNGQKAIKFKIAYINAFNQMEELLKANALPYKELTVEEKIAEALILSQGIIEKTKDELKKANRNNKYNKKVNQQLRQDIKLLKEKLNTTESSQDVLEMKQELDKVYQEKEYWEEAYSLLEIRLDNKECQLNNLLKVKRDVKQYFDLLSQQHSKAMPLKDNNSKLVKAYVFRKQEILKNKDIKYNNSISANFINKIATVSLNLALKTYVDALKSRLEDKYENVIGKDLAKEVDDFLMESYDIIQEVTEQQNIEKKYKQ